MLWALVLPPLTVHASGQDAPAPSVKAPNAAETIPSAATAGVVLAINGDRVTLNLGLNQGTKVGAIYAVMRNGQVWVSLQVIEVQPERSTARIISSDPNANFAVGDSVQFIADHGASGESTAPVLPAPTPANTAPPVIQTQPAKVDAPNGREIGSAGGSVVSKAGVTSVSNSEVTVAAGSVDGVHVGQNLPLLRGEEAIGMLKVQSVDLNSSVATVIWQDANAGAIVTGDSVQFSRSIGSAPRPSNLVDQPSVTEANPNAGFVPVKGSGTDGEASTPITKMPFETGASNITVPRADKTYQYLAALAASGAITSYPASVFEDEGVRYHRTAEDLTFTRSQIAGLIKEALDSQVSEESGSQSFITQELVREYRPELRQLGVELPALKDIASRRGIQVAVSGRQSATAVAGDKDNPVVPFSERQGGLRTRNGFDSQTNIFGRVGPRVTFTASVDAGSSPGDKRNSLGGDDEKTKFRRASLDYDASHILKGLTFQAGRDEVWLGPGHFGTLLLGDAAGPLNMLSYKFQRGPFSMGGYYSPLGHGPAGGSRSLYVRNAELRIGSQARVGLSESVLSPRDSFEPALFASAFSPVPLFLLRHNGSKDNQNGNLLQSLYAEAGVAAGLQTYGELLVDDIGLTNANLAENRIGSLVGLHLFDPQDPGKLGMYGEYARTAGRTYLRYGNLDPDYDYYFRNRPLGYPVAPPQGPGVGDMPSLGGAESLRLEGYWRPLPHLRLTAGAEFADLNSERLDLSRQQTYRFSATYNFTQALALSVRGQTVRTSQPDFIPGSDPLHENLIQFELSHSF